MLDYTKAFNQQKVLASQRHKIPEITRMLANYDTIDILTKIGSIYQAPENAGHSLMLDALLYATVLKRYRSDKPKITQGNFR